MQSYTILYKILISLTFHRAFSILKEIYETNKENSKDFSEEDSKKSIYYYSTVGVSPAG